MVKYMMITYLDLSGRGYKGVCKGHAVLSRSM